MAYDDCERKEKAMMLIRSRRGRWLMQSASDIFLGWAKGPKGRNFYVRQLRDMRSQPKSNR